MDWVLLAVMVLATIGMSLGAGINWQLGGAWRLIALLTPPYLVWCWRPLIRWWRRTT